MSHKKAKNGTTHPWLPWELEFLKNNYLTMPEKRLAKNLNGRTVFAIRSKIQAIRSKLQDQGLYQDKAQAADAIINDIFEELALPTIKK